MKRVVMVLCFSLVILSCGSRKSTARKKYSKTTKSEQIIKGEAQNNTEFANEQETISDIPVRISSTDEYLNLFSVIAQDEMRLYGIPASITLAQGILESNSGKGRLSIEANNHFGIKCHDWTGATIYHDDDTAQECFRKYKDAKYSFRDHSLFLTMRKRYSKLFELDKDDYKAWAHELKAAGYATDRKYPDKLISLIERYELYKLDNEVLGNKNSVNKENKPESTFAHIVMKGDTLYSISKKYNLTVKELQDLNGLNGTDINIGQELFVSPKSKNY